MQNKKIFCILFIIVFLCILFFFFISAPGNFPTGIIFQIAPGNSLRSVSSGLKEDHIIRSRLTFETLVMLFSGEKRVISADYYFENKLSVLEVAWRISKGEHHMAPIAFTIPEGYNNTQIADIFVSKLSNFDKNEFLLKTQGLEGRLFPDTYFFFTTASEKEVLESIRKNFEKKMSLIRADILNAKKTTGRTEQDIIIMASLIEGEAKGDIDRKVISGILWKRLSIGMPLQADAATSAALLQKEGYEVVGVFIKTWHPDFLECNEKEERRDAMRVAAHLDIPFLTFDFEDVYKKEVADYMISEYKAGRTPNPDVMCNKQVKFGAFLKKAISMGADYVATGHYARVARASRKFKVLKVRKEGRLYKLNEPYELLTGRDSAKDQSYFLWTLRQEQLKRILFPVGHLKQTEVRKLSKKFNLPV